MSESITARELREYENITASERREYQDVTARERSKYERMWRHDEYRTVSPAVNILPHIWSRYDGLRGGFTDFGVGTGRALAFVAQTQRFSCLGVDIAHNCLDPDLAGALPLLVTNLSSLWWMHLRPKMLEHGSAISPVQASGWCIDVLEHIDPSQINMAIRSLAAFASSGCYVRIANFPEGHGNQLIGEPLHLICEDAGWWKDRLQRAFVKAEQLHFEADECPPRYSFWCTGSLYD